MQLYALIFIESCFSDVIDGQVMVFLFLQIINVDFSCYFLKFILPFRSRFSSVTLTSD